MIIKSKLNFMENSQIYEAGTLSLYYVKIIFWKKFQKDHKKWKSFPKDYFFLKLLDLEIEAKL